VTVLNGFNNLLGLLGKISLLRSAGQIEFWCRQRSGNGLAILASGSEQRPGAQVRFVVLIISGNLSAGGFGLGLGAEFDYSNVKDLYYCRSIPRVSFGQYISI
jgi:hypothetical protein